MDELQLCKKRSRKTNGGKTAGKSLFLLASADDAVSLFMLTTKKTIFKNLLILSLCRQRLCHEQPKIVLIS